MKNNFLLPFLHESRSDILSVSVNPRNFCATKKAYAVRIHTKMGHAKKCLAVMILAAFSLTSCMTRAPSDYELDKQAGRLPKKDLIKKENLPDEEVYNVVGLNKDSKEPIRIEPRTEKVWIYDQETDSGHFLQGTYLYFQVDAGRWLNPGDIKQ